MNDFKVTLDEHNTKTSFNETGSWGSVRINQPKKEMIVEETTPFTALSLIVLSSFSQHSLYFLLGKIVMFVHDIISS